MASGIGRTFGVARSSSLVPVKATPGRATPQLPGPVLVPSGCHGCGGVLPGLGRTGRAAARAALWARAWVRTGWKWLRWLPSRFNGRSTDAMTASSSSHGRSRTTPADVGVGGHPRGQCLLAVHEGQPCAGSDPAQLDAQFGGEQASQGFAERGALGVAGVVGAQALAQVLPAGWAAVARRPPRADPCIEQDQVAVALAAGGVYQRGQRLLAALRLPDAEAGVSRPQRRRVRGAYGVRSVS